MAHPFHEHRQHKVEHSRVGHITRGYASGGGVGHSDEKQDRKLFKKLMKEEDSQEVEGGSVKERMDRPGRAGRKRGGKGMKRGGGGETVGGFFDRGTQRKANKYFDTANTPTGREALKAAAGTGAVGLVGKGLWPMSKVVTGLGG